jgi:AcrR family transcriptional regulator
MDKVNASGRREQKRRDTEKRIVEAGFSLFAEAGYEATTLDAIAETSGIARRTFFHYFNSKEDVLLAWQDGMPEIVRRSLLDQGRTASPFKSMQNALSGPVPEIDTVKLREIDAIIRASDRLRAANQAKFLVLEQVCFETLCEIWPEPARRHELRIVAMMTIGAMRIAIDDWATHSAPGPLSEHVKAAFAAVEHGVGLSENHS